MIIPPGAYNSFLIANFSINLRIIGNKIIDMIYQMLSHKSYQNKGQNRTARLKPKVNIINKKEIIEFEICSPINSIELTIGIFLLMGLYPYLIKIIF